MAASIARASKGAKVSLTSALRGKIQFWRFMDDWHTVIPWRHERRVALPISSDASLYRWAAVIHLKSSDKYMYAVVKALESLPVEVQPCRVDVHVDSQVTIHACSGQGTRSRGSTQVAKRIFDFVTRRNLTLTMSYVLSRLNPADWFSWRNLSKSDAMLSSSCWDFVQFEFGGVEGRNLDLMSLDSNTQRDKSGNPPHPTPNSSGVNVFNQFLSLCDGFRVNAYVFRPFCLISPLLRFLKSEGWVVTVVVPRQSLLPAWWPLINAMAQRKVLLTE